MDLFDLIGPVMIGPSSSHTAGAARIGLTARMLMGEEITRAEICLHGSFAKTYRGHGTDRALVGGLLGMNVLGAFVGVQLPVNPCAALLAGFLGLPGVALVHVVSLMSA